ncbi:hypothetical protein NT01EI_1758 [Edwardsiella ictaluri 93-146]|uniref:Uncharacterized protein n=1 Tax=Edwardsiella ictaluri (strain 93-146) TaxID=634503 RepID=C5BE17_EDWI9|nr:hypothetical protein NT01EI_1758 [Edwardsiella ictaluri 93-146]
MAQYHWRQPERVVFIFMKIRSIDAASFHFDEDFIIAAFRYAKAL